MTRPRPAMLVMGLGLVVAIGAAAAAIAVSEDGVALGVFVGTLVVSCLLACSVAWIMGERAARELEQGVAELARRRSGTRDVEAPDE